MLRFTIVHHIPGRIRIEVPILKCLSPADLLELSKLLGSPEGLGRLPTPSAIQDVRANPLTGSLVIRYDPKAIDILAYLTELASHEALAEFLRERP